MNNNLEMKCIIEMRFDENLNFKLTIDNEFPFPILIGTLEKIKHDLLAEESKNNIDVIYKKP